MGFLSKLLRGAHSPVKEVVQLDGPTSRGGASMNVYLHEDDSVVTVEFGWLGNEIARYEGEPRSVPPGMTMPAPPPRPAGTAPMPPLPQQLYQPTPQAPLEPAASPAARKSG